MSFLKKHRDAAAAVALGAWVLGWGICAWCSFDMHLARLRFDDLYLLGLFTVIPTLLLVLAYEMFLKDLLQLLLHTVGRLDSGRL